MNTKRKWRHNRLAPAVATAILLSGTSQVQALSFELGDEILLDLDSTVAYSAQWRVAKPDYNKNRGSNELDITINSPRINSDDGNYNFSRELVMNKISIVSEMNLAWRNFGFFGRGRAWYDDVYDGRTDHDEQEYLSYNSATIYGGTADFREFPDRTKEVHRDRLEMLDYYLYAGGELPGDRLFDVRVGSQAINWGTSTFFQGISGLQNPIDAISANNPGVELREVLLPTGAIYAQVDLTPDVTFETYYQYEWAKTELNGVGSFFSTQDWLGSGAENFLVPLSGFDPDTGELRPPIATKRNEGEADDNGQWGAAVHWITENGTDFGFYYVNAHSKTPSFYPPLDLQNYQVEYVEDIQGYAVSFTTVLGITNVQGEISYQTDRPVVDAAGNPDTGDVITAIVGGSHVVEPTAYWDSMNLSFDVALSHTTSQDSDELRFDDTGLAASVRAEIDYLNVYPALDIKLIPFINHTFDGTVREANMIEDATSVNFAVRAIYQGNFWVQAGYVNFFDGGDDNLLTDRDNVSLTVSYSF